MDFLPLGQTVWSSVLQGEKKGRKEREKVTVQGEAELEYFLLNGLEVEAPALISRGRPVRTTGGHCPGPPPASCWSLVCFACLSGWWSVLPTPTSRRPASGNILRMLSVSVVWLETCLFKWGFSLRRLYFLILAAPPPPSPFGQAPLRKSLGQFFFPSKSFSVAGQWMPWKTLSNFKTLSFLKSPASLTAKIVILRPIVGHSETVQNAGPWTSHLISRCLCFLK